MKTVSTSVGGSRTAATGATAGPVAVTAGAAADAVPHWYPDLQTLNSVITLLVEAGSSDTAVQKQVATNLSRFDQVADSLLYFCFVFVEGQQQSEAVRQRGGLILKHRITEYIKKQKSHSSHSSHSDSVNSATLSSSQASPSSTADSAAAAAAAKGNAGASTEQQQYRFILTYVKSSIIKAISDKNKIIRDTAGIILAAIAGADGVDKFPELLPSLFQLLEHPDPDVVHTTFSNLNKVIEDELERRELICHSRHSSHTASVPVENSFSSDSFVHFCTLSLIPKLLQLARMDASPAQKRHSLTCLNLLQRYHLLSPTDAFAQFFEQYWSCLGCLALDHSPEIRLLVLQGMCHASAFTPDIIAQSLVNVVPFVLECLSGSHSYEVRYEALELLSHILHIKDSRVFIEHSLPKLLHLLLENAKYSDMDYLQMDRSQFEDDNASVPDELRDIAPRFRRSQEGSNYDGDGDGDDDESSDDVEGGQNDSLGGRMTAKSTWGDGWTARKWSARTLDVLSFMYRENLLSYLLPEIEQRLQSGDWEVRESAVLVLGAISRGCMGALESYLPKIIEILVTLCEDNKPIVRSISLWSLGRFSICIGHRDELMRVMTRTILKHFLDKNKKVQQAACSAFATLEEDVGEELVLLIPEIIETFNKAFYAYQMNNMLVLLDAIGTLAECLGSKIDVSSVHDKIIRPLIEFFLQTSLKNNSMIIASFEAVTSVCLSLPEGLPLYAPPLVQRCIDISKDTLTLFDAYLNGLYLERPDRQLIECSFELMSAIVETMRSGIEPLLSRTDFILLVISSCELPPNIVGSAIKQSAFALIGDLSQHCPNYIRPHIVSIVPHVIPYISNGPLSVCNNASWAIGQLALHVANQHELDQWVQDIIKELMKVLESPVHPESIVRNAAITIGRVACSSPAIVANSITPLFGLWCRVLESASNDSEKVYAFTGVCHILHNNKQLAIEHMAVLLDSICSLYLTPPPAPAMRQYESTDQVAPVPPSPSVQVPPETQQIFRQLVAWLHSACTAEWANAMMHVKPFTNRVVTSWASETGSS